MELKVSSRFQPSFSFLGRLGCFFLPFPLIVQLSLYFSSMYEQSPSSQRARLSKRTKSKTSELNLLLPLIFVPFPFVSSGREPTRR